MTQQYSAQAMPQNIGTIHIIGIGGIGMSGIAEILHSWGYVVQGSDMAENANVVRLREQGITVHVGHKESNVNDVAVIVKSTAVKDTNPEIQEAKKQHIPVLKRSEMLAEIFRLKKTVAISGSHGKTTTTSMVAQLFEAASMSPTVINGGIINSRATNAYMGEGEWLVAEADESDGTFIAVPSTVGVVTNIDPEHLDHYGSFEVLIESFRTFITQLPFYGFAVACKDHPIVRDIIAGITNRKIVTYGIESEDVDIRAVDIVLEADHSLFSLEIDGRITKDGKPKKIEQIRLPMPGLHNVSNATAALAVAIELGFDDKVITEGLHEFKGVQRRFTITGKVHNIMTVDDYAHHPKEILATIKTAKKAAESQNGRVIAIVQPHRYSRLKECFDEFATCVNEADITYIAPVFEAGESPIEGIDSAHLVEAIKQQGYTNVSLLPSLDQLAEHIQPVAQPYDIVVGMGAGTITAYMKQLPEQLEQHQGIQAETA